MFCSRCGTWAPDDSTTCSLCGLALQVDNWPREAKPAPPASTLTPHAAAPAPVLELVTYAGFWRRFFGRLIDFVVTFFPIATVRVLLGLQVWAPFEPPSTASSWATLFGLLIDWLYAACFISSSMRGTLGQQIMDLHVTGLPTAIVRRDDKELARMEGNQWLEPERTLFAIVTTPGGVPRGTH